MDEVGGFVYESGCLFDEPGFRAFLFSGGWARSVTEFCLEVP